MDEFDNYFSDEFFVIDSNNLDAIETRLYGFIMDDGKIIKNENLQDLNQLSYEGSYIFIQENNDCISIFQDFNGSYGLYFYYRDNYFAISNSFLYLVEYLKNFRYLTLNDDYVAALLSTDFCSVVYKETLVNEIEMIPRNRIIRISKCSKDLSFEKLDFEEHTVDLDSKHALEILDNWFYKWINIIRLLKKKTNNIQFDLSGGFDTRIVLLLLLSANVDLKKIDIRSFTDGEHNHDADLAIANKFAKQFNFKVNNKILSTKKIDFKDIGTPLKISFYTKLGFHNQFNYKFYRTEEPIYKFSGVAGETIRPGGGYGYLTPQGFINQMANRARNLDSSFEIPTVRIHTSSLNNLREEYNIPETSWEVTEKIYPETRCRNHYGKLSVEKYFSNKLLFIPSLDPNLHRLKLNTDECKDKFLLIALIFIRYCPKLLETNFEGNRGIKESTINFAKEINNISPFKPKNLEFISGPELNKSGVKYYYNTDDTVIRWEENGKYIKWSDVDDYLKNIFRSHQFKKEFEKYFPVSIYDNISESFDKINYFPLQRSYSTFSILKIINDIKFSKCHNNPKLLDWFDSYDKKKLLTDKTVAIIKKYGFFDYEFYNEQLDYDVNYDLLNHYLNIGYKEGKNPSMSFDGNYYLKKHEDVKKSGMNPLVHYVLYGIKESRRICPVLNSIDICSRLISETDFEDFFKDNNNLDITGLYSALNKFAKGLKGVNLLEIGSKYALFNREDFMGVSDIQNNNWADINNFINHKYYEFPYPIDKFYDLVILNNLLQNFKIKNCNILFNELKRITNNVLLLSSFKQLNGEFIKFLSDNATLVKGGIYGEVILQLYEF